MRRAAGKGRTLCESSFFQLKAALLSPDCSRCSSSNLFCSLDTTLRKSSKDTSLKPVRSSSSFITDSFLIKLTKNKRSGITQKEEWPTPTDKSSISVGKDRGCMQMQTLRFSWKCGTNGAEGVTGCNNVSSGAPSYSRVWSNSSEIRFHVISEAQLGWSLICLGWFCKGTRSVWL